MSVYEARSRLANEVKKSKRKSPAEADVIGAITESTGARTDDGTSPTEDPVTVARGDLAVEKLRAYVERAVAEAPPLNAEQRNRLAVLFRGAGASS